MAIKVNPNRMELLKLRKRLATAKRGHKLLRDKFDELMKKFLVIVEQNRRLRQVVESKLIEFYQQFMMVRAEASLAAIEEALLYPRAEIKVETEISTILNVQVAQFKLLDSNLENFDSYSLGTTPASLDDALFALQSILPKLIELAQVENTLELLANEIEKTRRRVNALEYVLIPQLEATIKMITMKLDEIERSNLTRLMKIKEMVGERVI
jgi:V/A-type H+-transporting ATPase subunit D